MISHDGNNGATSHSSIDICNRGNEDGGDCVEEDLEVEREVTGIEGFLVVPGGDSHHPCEGSDPEEDRSDPVPLVDGGNSIEDIHACSIACAHDGIMVYNTVV